MKLTTKDNVIVAAMVATALVLIWFGLRREIAFFVRELF